ncbi:hypothetical protein NLG42_14140 [Flavobacterium plurextorum]|uniref:hypothetical protein n=1 Tax=Flavobacterium TaxID=237 RepID=UPI00214DAB1A|nr:MULTISPECIES: hypothetical protein [Flavobacterium]UUW07244.1 hypothetical protein NLG42_14140 [Flavobacterium plurextorum]
MAAKNKLADILIPEKFMKKQQINLLNELIEKRNEIFLGGNFNLLIHSVLNTIQLSILIDYYLIVPNNDLKASIESNLLKRIETYNYSSKIYSKLHRELINSDYSKRQRIRIILYALLPNLKKIHYEDFFETFYNSKYQNDIKYALKIYDNVTNTKRDNILLRDYEETDNESYLKAFIEFGNEEILAINIEKIWMQKPSEYLKNRMVKRLMNNHMKRLEFIEQINPEHFLYILCNSRKEVKDETLIKCFSEISDEIKHFAIFNLSKTGRWKLIENEIKKYIS